MNMKKVERRTKNLKISIVDSIKYSEKISEIKVTNIKNIKNANDEKTGILKGIFL